MSMIALETVDSTNRYLKWEIMAGRLSKAAVWARTQTMGRGRLERSWSSPEGGLYLSVSRQVDQIEPHFLAVAAAIAIAERLRETHQEIGLKWPNDLIVSKADATGTQCEYKLGGILAEYLSENVSTPHAIVGIGINVNTEVALQSAVVSSLQPICLYALDGAKRDIDALARDLAAHVFGVWDALCGEMCDTTKNQAHLISRWKAINRTLGKRVRIFLPNQRLLEGEAIDVDEHFALLVKDDDKQIHALHAGDCIHLRTADVAQKKK